MTHREPERTRSLLKHPLYNTWRGVLSRCEDPGDPDYPSYGGRGITVYPKWHDLAAFIAWIEQNLGTRPDRRYAGRQPVYSLDRINNDGDYEPGNLQWADKGQQARNRRPRRKAVRLGRMPRTLRHWD